MDWAGMLVLSNRVRAPVCALAMGDCQEQSWALVGFFLTQLQAAAQNLFSVICAQRLHHMCLCDWCSTEL